jgi:NitT/TauT family transport system permease protein
MSVTAQTAAIDIAEPRPSKRPWYERYRVYVGVGVVTLFFAIWELAVAITGISRFVLPAPSSIFNALLFLLQQGYFWEHFRLTVTEILTGFSIAIAFGVTMGILIGRSRLAEVLCSPFIIASQVTPKVGLMPLFLLWLGFGMESKIAMVALLSFFPILKATVLGIRSIEENKRHLFAIHKASTWQRITKLEIPAVLPFIMTGIETASVLAVTGAIVGEYLGGNKGLGAYIVIALNSLMIDRMFATIIVLATFGFAFYSSISTLRRLVVGWHESVRNVG